MYSRKYVRLRIEPYGGINRVLLWRLSLQNCLKVSVIEYWRNKVKNKSWNSRRLELMNRTSRSNSVESTGSIHSFCLSIPRFVKNPDSSVRYNCLKVCCWMARPEIILKIKRLNFQVDQQAYYVCTTVNKDFINNKKKTNRTIVFSYRLLSNTFKHRDHGQDFPT